MRAISARTSSGICPLIDLSFPRSKGLVTEPSDGLPEGFLLVAEFEVHGRGNPDRSYG